MQRKKRSRKKYVQGKEKKKNGKTGSNKKTNQKAISNQTWEDNGKNK